MRPAAPLIRNDTPATARRRACSPGAGRAWGAASASGAGRVAVIENAHHSGRRAYHGGVPETDPARMLDGIRVLVVDDEPDVRELVAAVLEECGAMVTTASSVDKALAALRQEIPDVLVTDIGMAERTGYDLIRAVRALPPDKGGALKAVALTAHSTLEDAEAAMEAGFTVHLPKPAYPAEMVSLLARLVGR